MADTKAVAVLDWGGITRFLRSVALAVAIRSNTRLEFKPWEEESCFNMLNPLSMTNIDWWLSEPGQTGEPTVTQEWEAIKAMRDEQYRKYRDRAVEELAKGPAAIAAYLQDKGVVRARMMAETQEIWRKARRITDQKSGSAGDVLVVLHGVKLASAITIFALSGGAAIGLVGASASGSFAVGSAVTVSKAAAAGWASFGYEIAVAVAENWDEVATASILALNLESKLPQSVAKDSMEFSGENIASGYYAGKTATYSNNLAVEERNAVKKLKKLSGKLGEELSENKRGQTVRRMGRASQDAAAARAKLTVLKIAGKSIPIVFMLNDMRDAVKDFSTGIEQARN